MATPPHEEPHGRKSSKAVPLAILGVLSLTLVGVWAVSEANDDDDDVAADCVMLVNNGATPTPGGDFASASPTPSGDFASASPTSASPTPSTTTSPPPAGSYQVVDDDYCDDDSRRYYGGGHSHLAYVWYYGGIRHGNRVSGGTTLRPSNVNISSRSGKEIQRSGFGHRTSSGG